MNLSPSIDVIWRLAANEMAAGEFKEIAPEHFCMALLKFSELSAQAPENADEQQAEMAKIVSEEAQLLREALQKCGIESMQARRKLRGQLGKGGSPYCGGTIHRSPASRALFESAIKLASEAASEVVTPLHLLTAVVQSPTPAIAQVVLGKALQPPAPARLPPFLEEHCRDLVKEGAEGKLNASKPGIQTQCKAVLGALQDKERRSILLVSDSEDAVFDLAIALAKSIAANDVPEGLRGKRLIDVAWDSRADALRGMRLSREEKAKELERMRHVLAEAANHPELILLVPAVEDEPRPESQGGEWTTLVRETLTKRTAQFICRVPPSVFTKHLFKDKIWTRHAQVIWLEKLQDSAPREL